MASDEAGKKEKYEFLITRSTYLKAGVHIGTKIATKPMKKYVYTLRADGLYVLNLRKVDERIRLAGKYLSRFNPEDVFVSSSRIYALKPVKMFGEVTRFHYVAGRTPPGKFSNYLVDGFMEPEVIFVSDPKLDKRVMMEAASKGIMVMALCDTNNQVSFVDFVIPANNKGRKSLALIYWLIARQVLRERGEIPSDGDLELTPKDFETEVGVTF